MVFNQMLNRSKLLTKHFIKANRDHTAKFLKYGQEKAEKMTRIVAVPLQTHIKNTVQIVDDTLGVSQVNEAQEKVTLQEAEFLAVRACVHEMKQALDEKQNILHETRKKLDRVERADERYLTYVADEHNILLEVKKLQRDYSVAEEKERQQFIEFSSAVRLSHEKERARVERTKYWSIIGSVVGTVFGFMLSSLVTHYRLKRMKVMTSAAITQASSDLHNDIGDQTNIFLQKVQTLHDSVVQNIPVHDNTLQTRPAADIDNRDSDVESLIRSLENSIRESDKNSNELLVNSNRELLALVEKSQCNIQNILEQMRDLSTTNEEKRLLESINEGMKKMEYSTKEALENLQSNLNEYQSVNDYVTKLLPNTDLKEAMRKEELSRDSYLNVQTLNLFLAGVTLAFVVCTSPHFYW